jgi:hypothetical protein
MRRRSEEKPTKSKRRKENKKSKDDEIGITSRKGVHRFVSPGAGRPLPFAGISPHGGLNQVPRALPMGLHCYDQGILEE